MESLDRPKETAGQSMKWGSAEAQPPHFIMEIQGARALGKTNEEGDPHAENETICQSAHRLCIIDQLAHRLQRRRGSGVGGKWKRFRKRGVDRNGFGYGIPGDG